LITIEFGMCGSVIAVPNVVSLMGNSFTWGNASVPLLHAFGAGVPVSVQVTYAVAPVGAVPVMVPVTRLLVIGEFVPMLQLFGRQEADIPTVPAATALTVAPVLVPPTVATAGCVLFHINAGNVVSG
jgi:hypothetical protein